MIREFTIKKTETSTVVIPKADTMYNSMPFELNDPKDLFEFVLSALDLKSKWVVILRKRRKE